MADRGSELTARAAVDRAFGAENRARLLADYLSQAEAVNPTNAWRHVYRLLVWIDRSIGLAHCYESDKCQPGRPWYRRSLQFHDYISTQLGHAPAELGRNVDVLFRQAATDLARAAVAARADAGAEQRRAYEGRGFPRPGEDLELVALVGDLLRPYFVSEPPAEAWRELTERIHTYLGEENKRKNLLGEGFEDTLAALIRQLPISRGWQVHNRVLLENLPGFQPQAEIEKRKRVDLAIWNEQLSRRILVTAKWSVRADREEQFGTDFDAYVRVNRSGPFDYVLITNEFDAARLKAACTRLAGNSYLFTRVVHVNPEGVLAAYDGTGPRGAALELPAYLTDGRLVSLERWLSETFE